MGCNLGGKCLGGEQPLMAAGGRGGTKVDEGNLVSPKVPWGLVEDRVVLGEARRPAPGVGNGTLPGLWGLEDGTREDGGCGSLLRSRWTRVRIGKAVGQENCQWLCNNVQGRDVEMTWCS